MNMIGLTELPQYDEAPERRFLVNADQILYWSTAPGGTGTTVFLNGGAVLYVTEDMWKIHDMLTEDDYADLVGAAQ